MFVEEHGGIRKLTTKKQRARVVVGCHALEKCQRVADAVRRSCGELRRVKQRVHGDDFLDQRSHHA